MLLIISSWHELVVVDPMCMDVDLGYLDIGYPGTMLRKRIRDGEYKGCAVLFQVAQSQLRFNGFP